MPNTILLTHTLTVIVKYPLTHVKLHEAVDKLESKGMPTSAELDFRLLEGDWHIVGTWCA